jgi:alanine-synthesizing transaminase
VFSRRLPADLRPNAFTLAKSALGVVPYDLTVSNPTSCGIPYPPDLLEPLARPEGLAYRPDAKGIRAAREAVALEYAARGTPIDPERIVLTASSSEAYGLLFKLLCDPGDAVLVPTPSYPLFEHLAALDGVRSVPYALDPTHGWQPRPPAEADLHGVRAAILVHPNNPTGSWVEAGAAETLAVGMAGAAIPLIVDEVFLDFAFEPHPASGSFASRARGLTFTLGGLSKSRGLPQLKLSWIVVGGPDAPVREALDALEFVADNYLSVGTPVQEALPELLVRARPVRDAILARCSRNLAVARALARRVPAVEVLAPQAGWSVVVRFPRVIAEEALVLDLLERRGVAVHPGYFFDFAAEGYLVASLLPESAIFEAGLVEVLDAIAANL